MTRRAPLLDIVSAIAGLRVEFPTTQWYGFGSFFNGRHSFSDIDVLAVCANETELLGLRQAIEHVAMDWPIHLIVMTKIEEAETDFVVRQGCRLLEDSNVLE